MKSSRTTSNKQNTIEAKLKSKIRYFGKFLTAFLIVLEIGLVLMLFKIPLVKAEPLPQTDNNTKIGLLVIAHGSPHQAWNNSVSNLQKPLELELQKKVGEKANNWLIKVCFLECEPSIAKAMAEFEQSECQRVIAVPLFVAPSGHSIWDVPAVLNIYSDPQIQKELIAEGIEIVDSVLPVTLTGTLSTTQIMEQWAADRILEISHNPDEEAVVIIAHGDEDIRVPWENLMRRVAVYICGKSSITYADWAFVEVGQSYRKHGIGTIELAKQNRRRVLVVGLYIGLNAADINKRWGEGIIDDDEVIFINQALLPEQRIITWIIDSALNSINMP